MDGAAVGVESRIICILYIILELNGVANGRMIDAVKEFWEKMWHSGKSDLGRNFAEYFFCCFFMLSFTGAADLKAF